MRPLTVSQSKHEITVFHGQTAEITARPQETANSKRTDHADNGHKSKTITTNTRSGSFSGELLDRSHHQPDSRSCNHPRGDRVDDREAGERICKKCGLVIGSVQVISPNEKLNRQPENAIVHRSNRGAGSKRAGVKGPQPHHLHVLTELYGNREGTKQAIDTILETCRNCKHQIPVKLFGEIKHCPDCQAEIGYYTFRYLPNGHGNATRFWADLRLLEAYDGPDDDPVLKMGREILSSKLLGHVSDEEAHWLAKKCLAGLAELSKVTRREVESVIDSILEGEKVLCKSR